MKTHIIAIICAIFALQILHAQEPPKQQPLTAAILDFQVANKEFEKIGAEFALLLNAQLSSAPNVILVERQELDKILGEQELSLSGNVTPDTAAKIGRLTGAKTLITGRVFGGDGKFYAVAKIMSTETGRVFAETAIFKNIGDLNEPAADLAPKIAAVLEKQADALVAKAEPPAVRINRFKKLLEGKTLPSVAVKITEQHIGPQRAIDPAVQTEIALVLQKLGFEVIDPAAPAKKPDVTISGEAFSEMAARRANLVSCRSRVEIKVVRAATNKLLLIDRQTDVAVDIAENVAGKNALENAARKLIDRIVPALVAPSDKD